jgi:flagellum-specific peptidoglycan hydrolase FlgJ
MTDLQLTFLRDVHDAAVKAQHVWPAMAACEAALESNWGVSRLAREARNLFGLKRPSAWTGQTISIPTQEYLHGTWVTVSATWPVFRDFADCMTERMHVLRANHVYAPALAAKTAEEYISAVSRVWATDPQRGLKVQSIWLAHAALLSTPIVST